jgi:hypothetical protein
MTLPPPDSRAPATARLPQAHGSLSIYPLSALDGVLLNTLKNGETFEFYFGPTDEAAAEALAADVSPEIADGPDGGTT